MYFFRMSMFYQLVKSFFSCQHINDIIMARSHPELKLRPGRSRRYRFLRYLGGGSFGDIFSGTDLDSGSGSGHIIALKVESNESTSRQVKKEFDLYRKYLSGVEGFPQVFHWTRSKKHNFFTMTLLGDNLEMLYRGCEAKFRKGFQNAVWVQIGIEKFFHFFSPCLSQIP